MPDPIRRVLPRPENSLRLDATDAGAVSRETAPDDAAHSQGDIASRPPLRKPVREESPRERAAKRAAELRGHGGVEQETVNEFYLPAEIIPDGWSYEWKRHTLFGKEDPAYQVALARGGWEAVPASRHPEQMPMAGAHQTITRKGMILMERPMEITEEVRRRDQQKARNQVRAKEEQLGATPPGTFDRGGDSRVRPNIRKTYSPVQIPPNSE
jgi:hypothetical protein